MIWVALAWAAEGGELPEWDAQTFRPSLDAQHMVWTDDSHIATGEGGVGFGMRAMGSWTNDPLAYTTAAGLVTPLVGDVLQVDLMPSLHVDRLRVGLYLPFFPMATTVENQTPAWGDGGVDGRGVVFDAEEAPVGLALQGRVRFPTGLLSGLRSRRVTYEASIVSDVRVGPHHVALNVGYRGGPLRDLEGLVLDDAVTGRAGYAWVGRDWGAAVELTSAVPTASAISAREAWLAEWMVSGNYRWGAMVLTLGGGTGITASPGSPDARLVLGVSYDPAQRDPDGDSVLGRADACPRDPEDHDGVSDADGCADASAGDPRRR